MILVNLILKEILQFFRNKSNIATMFIFPVVLIVIMGFALKGLMNVDTNLFDNKKVYFELNNISSESKYFQQFYNMKKELEKMKIRFEEISNDYEGKNAVNDNSALAFIIVEDDKYIFYRNETRESNAQKMFRSAFEEYLDGYAVIDTVLNKNPSIIRDLKEGSDITVSDEGISSKGIDSFTYYTFAELVLIILYISQVTSVSTYNEGFQNTFSRLRIARVNDFNIILSKIILGLIVGIFQIAVVYFVSNVFLKISWGNNLLEVILVLISLIIFSSILGVSISYIFKDSKAASSVINILLIVLGFLGGAYLPLSLVKSNEVTNILCKLTPTYWANTSLLSLSSGIHSKYSTISILFSLAFSVILIIICISFRRIKVGDRIA